MSRSVIDIAKRKHNNIATVALANRTARMAWARLYDKADHDPSLVVG